MAKNKTADIKHTDIYKACENFWKVLRKNNPYKGMTTQQILDKIRAD